MNREEDNRAVVFDSLFCFFFSLLLVRQIVLANYELYEFAPVFFWTFWSLTILGAIFMTLIFLKAESAPMCPECQKQIDSARNQDEIQMYSIRTKERMGEGTIVCSRHGIICLDKDNKNLFDKETT